MTSPNLRQLPQSIFDAYALALPRGLGFGDYPPVEAYISDDGHSWAAVTRREDGTFGTVAMRKRVDHAWMQTIDRRELASLEAARNLASSALKEGQPPEPLPPGVMRRLPLWDVEDREPSKIFRRLSRPTHHVAAWMLNQLYSSMPSPDANWASDCQTDNFHMRLWEAQLFAALREQGLLVTQPQRSPDFHISNRRSDEAWIEAVTANPDPEEDGVYDHADAKPTMPPEDIRQRMMGRTAVRFAKTIGNKLQKRYDQLPHVVGKSFVIALTDFHAPSSMVWSREALAVYLYGKMPHVEVSDGQRIVTGKTITHLLGPSGFPAGLFANGKHAELAAVIFTNTCTIAKLSRVPVSAGFSSPNYRHVRIGMFYDRTPGALTGIPFSFDVTSADYRRLWPPYSYEPWCAELEVYHNPYARHPIPRELLPEAQHWFSDGEEIGCNAYFETSILKSQTHILDADQPVPSAEQYLRTNDLGTLYRGTSDD